jgi:hypothetical protein
MITPSNGLPPKFDGQIQLYETPHKKWVSQWYQPLKRVVYINGQVTTGERHMECARALSHLLMCPVIGVFNQTYGTSFYGGTLDTLQSVGDKLQFHEPLSGGPKRYFSRFLNRQETRTGRKPEPLPAMEKLLERNRATLATFRLLRSREVTKSTPIFAHSQGNLILSNALTAISLVDGPMSVAGREIYSYGCPTVNWPAGIKQFDSAFTGDLIAMINPVPNFAISKVGLPTGEKPWGFISHDFMLYLKDDAQFVINRFRWGGWGITVSMDKDGLASALVQMGNNEPRVSAIFHRLETNHKSVAGDVSEAYVRKMMSNPSSAALLKSMRNTPLVPMLIRLMAEGRTTAKEKVAIDDLKNL